MHREALVLLKTLELSRQIRRNWVWSELGMAPFRGLCTLKSCKNILYCRMIFSVQMQLMRLRRSIDLRIEPHPIWEGDFNIQNPFAYESQQTGIELK